MKLWGGRFNKKTNKFVDDFTRSIQYDQVLAKYDCLGSLYHIAVLRRAKLLSSAEYAKLKKGLLAIIAQIKSGTFKINKNFEDIHSYIQFLLKQKIGNPADKLQTCRSRNDQVVFCTKLYCLDQIQGLKIQVKGLQSVFQAIAKKNRNVYLPGFTHLQHAMAISLADYFTAYDAMLARDFTRLDETYQHIVLTMGSGALAGTMIDAAKYHFPAQGDLLKPISPASNALDTVSDRDFVIETLSSLAILGMHLSRLSEDMVLWATKEFDFVDIDDAFCTGSSLMPQKKNPDVLELIRGYSGRLYSHLLDVLIVMKGLPLSYNRDMQLDKEPLFSSFNIANQTLAVLTEMLKNLKFKTQNMEKQISDEALYATDMADVLVKKGVPFHSAHAIIGKLIQIKNQQNCEISKMDDTQLRKIHQLLNSKDLRQVINPQTSVHSKKSIRRKRV